MIDSLIAFDSFDKLFRDIGIHPYQKNIVVVVLFIVKFVVKIFLNEIMDEWVLGFEHNF